MPPTLVNVRFAWWFCAILCAAAPARAQIEMGGGRIDVVFEAKETGVPQDMLLAWIKTAARAVTDYYGQYRSGACWCGSNQSTATQLNPEKHLARARAG